MRYFILILMLLPVSLFAQEDKSEVRKGNRLFKKGEFAAAEVEYRKALLRDSASVAATYDLANALYKKKEFEQAATIMSKLADSLPEHIQSPAFYHNLANSYVQLKKYQEAVDAYKQSLRAFPDDMETKTNLAYAQKMLKDQQNQQNQQDQNKDQQDQNKDQQDQNKDQQDQNKDQQDQNKDQQDQNKDQQDQNKDQQDQNKDQGPQPKISKQDAKQMLKAIEAKEKKTQEKVKAEKAKALKGRKKEKNW